MMAMARMVYTRGSIINIAKRTIDQRYMEISDQRTSLLERQPGHCSMDMVVPDVLQD